MGNPLHYHYEMQIKAVMKYHYPLIRMAQPQNTDNTKRKLMNQQELICCSL